MLNLLLICNFIIATDILSITIAKKINPMINIYNNQNIRWFFIHSISNVIITVYSVPDLIFCIKNMNQINNFTWTQYSYNSFYFSILTHIYHILFFDLTRGDKLHHFLMVLIAGSIEFYRKSIISSAALFFLSGLPGAIDYFLLFLVKLDILSKKKEKIIYLYLSAFIRSPGSCIISIIGIYNIILEFNKNTFISIISLISSGLVFWNGQYYLMISSIDYGKFIERNNI